mmetsp:Transcript_8992/g.17593  ORF Transcript_8992/g.17593 Transcript_8992/m.17593 type:complete len:95 (+) Transcript_8992:89-373(+)
MASSSTFDNLAPMSMPSGNLRMARRNIMQRRNAVIFSSSDAKILRERLAAMDLSTLASEESSSHARVEAEILQEDKVKETMEKKPSASRASRAG